MSWLSAPICTFVVFWFIYLVFELFVRRDERRMLIEKIVPSGKIDISKYLSPYISSLDFGMSRNVNRNNALRTGLLMIGIGAGLLLGFFLNSLASTRGWDSYWETTSIIYTSCVCLCGGVAFIIAYNLERKHGMQDRETLMQDMKDLSEETETGGM
ncbi:MAG: hypothetical protein NC206_04695 [Bacteroides sp.]|nr:hypothetical protein [Roseburia sp.]MCM1346363.1 hypothetical protein [Bacteroides sp.]MCM1420398.1 hypothetical protein [Bacteroides sp.]